MPAKTFIHFLYNPSTKGVSETPFTVGKLGWYPGKSWPLPLHIIKDIFNKACSASGPSTVQSRGIPRLRMCRVHVCWASRVHSRFSCLLASKCQVSGPGDTYFELKIMTVFVFSFCAPEGCSALLCMSICLSDP